MAVEELGAEALGLLLHNLHEARAGAVKVAGVVLDLHGRRQLTARLCPGYKEGLNARPRRIEGRSVTGWARAQDD